jgi:enoyl-[acyl-carrier protein] reductase / trans-2-enoyl-CoA reductase (NAD+)
LPSKIPTYPAKKRGTTARDMTVAFPSFQYRFMPAMGHVIFPANFHPVGTQRAAQAMIERVASAPAAGSAEGSAPAPGAGGRWLVVGGSGGFGSAARAVLGARRGAHTLNVSLDALPALDSNNRVRQVGSPGFHRTLALEKALRARGLVARTVQGDAFDPEVREAVIAEIREHFGGKLDGIVWSLAAPRALDPRTGKAVSSFLRPLGSPVTLKTFSGRDERAGTPPKIVEMTIPPGTPEEAVGTIYVMGGGIVDRFVSTLLAADVLAPGATVLTISYRGNPLNEGLYRKGLIGLAKADLEHTTRALDAVLQARVGGRAIAVEGPAVVTEASGGIPGVPLYLAHVMDVMGEQFEDPTASMMRMFDQHFGLAGSGFSGTLDAEGLLRMDDRELAEPVQAEMTARFAAANPGDVFPDALYDAFMTAYAQTRGFSVPGIDYEAELDPAVVCAGG